MNLRRKRNQAHGTDYDYDSFRFISFMLRGPRGPRGVYAMFDWHKR